MEPEYENPTLWLSSIIQMDNSSLPELTHFVGSTGANYSGQTDGQFTFSVDGITIDVTGSGFVYSDGVPVGGFVTYMDVMIGNATAYSIGASEEGGRLPISLLFSTSDPVAMANALFSGDENVNGSALDDTLFGMVGDDYVNGGGGADLLYGGDGDDLLSGGAGEDKLYGGNGDDWLSGGSDNDILRGGKGVDIAWYNDKLVPVVVDLGKGKTPKAKIGYDEVDKLKGIEGVLGGLGDDKLVGDRGDNPLGGNAGDDLLKGKGGDDTLSGGWGIDTLVGGKGSDVFLFDKPVAIGGSVHYDKIKDFDPGVDSIHLAQEFFASLDPGVLAPEHFYAASGAFAGVGDTYMVYDTRNGVLYYDASGDGSGPVLKVASLKGAPSLTASDIFVIAPPEDLIN